MKYKKALEIVKQYEEVEEYIQKKSPVIVEWWNENIITPLGGYPMGKNYNRITKGFEYLVEYMSWYKCEPSYDYIPFKVYFMNEKELSEYAIKYLRQFDEGINELEEKSNEN